MTLPLKISFFCLLFCVTGKIYNYFEVYFVYLAVKANSSYKEITTHYMARKLRHDMSWLTLIIGALVQSLNQRSDLFQAKI